MGIIDPKIYLENAMSMTCHNRDCDGEQIIAQSCNQCHDTFQYCTDKCLQSHFQEHLDACAEIQKWRFNITNLVTPQSGSTPSLSVAQQAGIAKPSPQNSASLKTGSSSSSSANPSGMAKSSSSSSSKPSHHNLSSSSSTHQTGMAKPSLQNSSSSSSANPSGMPKSSSSSSSKAAQYLDVPKSVHHNLSSTSSTNQTGMPKSSSLQNNVSHKSSSSSSSANRSGMAKPSSSLHGKTVPLLSFQELARKYYPDQPAPLPKELTEREKRTQEFIFGGMKLCTKTDLALVLAPVRAEPMKEIDKLFTLTLLRGISPLVTSKPPSLANTTALTQNFLQPLIDKLADVINAAIAVKIETGKTVDITNKLMALLKVDVAFFIDQFKNVKPCDLIVCSILTTELTTGLERALGERVRQGLITHEEISSSEAREYIQYAWFNFLAAQLAPNGILVIIEMTKIKTLSDDFIPVTKSEPILFQKMGTEFPKFGLKKEAQETWNFPNEEFEAWIFKKPSHSTTTSSSSSSTERKAESKESRS